MRRIKATILIAILLGSMLGFAPLHGLGQGEKIVFQDIDEYDYSDIEESMPEPIPELISPKGRRGGVPRDSDGDGYSDIVEMLAGTDPYDPCDPDPECDACLFLSQVRLDYPIENVTIGDPMSITGTATHRADGFPVYISVSGPTEFPTQTALLINGTFNTTFDTTGAEEGEYLVMSDDLYGCTDQVTVFLTEREAKTWYVDDDGGPGIDFTNIQDAVDVANPEDIIFVYNGAYYEDGIFINKDRITLQGEDAKTTTIYGLIDKWHETISIHSNYTNISGFTITGNSGSEAWYAILIEEVNKCNISNNIITLKGASGILMHKSDNNIISNNHIFECEEGIDLKHSNGSMVYNNVINSNCPYGIVVWDDSSANSITKNIISNNSIYLNKSYCNNFYLNNFVNISVNLKESNNVWNSTLKISYTYNETTYRNYMGNYWSDYIFEGNDTNGDGIGDSPYSIDSDEDKYPLMEPWENYFKLPEEEIFDTGSPANPYPSIMGTHNGTIKPNKTITVSMLYTYPCIGTGGHTESIELYKNGTLIANGSWNGYRGEWHNITIHNVTGGTPYVTLLENHEYNYTIITGSYPQIHHNRTLKTTNGWINCTEFEDANGKKYDNWIPAIKLE